MAGKVLDIVDLLIPVQDRLAVSIATQYTTWEQLRSTWAAQKKELRNYLFATDTRTTANATLPWKNSTTTPKLTQIRDNLHANYMEALFPNEDWLVWEGNRESDESEAKRSAIENYMKTKLRQDNAETKVSDLILDFIDYGNVFMTAEWADESTVNDDGQQVRGYVGPRLVRISPFDIVFNPLAASFEETPKITRRILSLGELAKSAKGLPKDSEEAATFNHALNRSSEIRKTVRNMAQGDVLKSDGYVMDGFSSMQQYFSSDYVEILTFHGDLYDVNDNHLYENYRISIIDRSFIVSKKPNPNWTTHPGIFHVGWRQRPDNLYAMGPLDNLVGMQYRIDHLENLKADVFDMIALPMTKTKGYVEDFVYGPNERINCGDDGDVEFLMPPHESLNADMQIDRLEGLMEQLAGAPREAMGIRSPGEKTKFEVQKLDNAASRIFNNKIEYFQKVGLEKVLNFMLQLARRNMSSSDVIRTLDSDIDAVVFSTVSKDDIVANGILRPRGAEHFAERANALQNFIQFSASPIYADAAVQVHLSGKKIAKLIEELADWQKYKIYKENIRVIEQEETKKLMQSAGEQTDIQGATPPGILPSDPSAPQQ